MNPARVRFYETMYHGGQRVPQLRHFYNYVVSGGTRVRPKLKLKQTQPKQPTRRKRTQLLKGAPAKKRNKKPDHLFHDVIDEDETALSSLSAEEEDDTRTSRNKTEKNTFYGADDKKVGVDMSHESSDESSINEENDHKGADMSDESSDESSTNEENDHKGSDMSYESSGESSTNEENHQKGAGMPQDAQNKLSTKKENDHKGAGMPQDAQNKLSTKKGNDHKGAGMSDESSDKSSTNEENDHKGADMSDESNDDSSDHTNDTERTRTPCKDTNIGDGSVEFFLKKIESCLVKKSHPTPRFTQSEDHEEKNLAREDEEREKTRLLRKIAILEEKLKPTRL